MWRMVKCRVKICFRYADVWGWGPSEGSFKLSSRPCWVTESVWASPDSLKTLLDMAVKVCDAAKHWHSVRSLIWLTALVWKMVSGRVLNESGNLHEGLGKWLLLLHVSQASGWEWKLAFLVFSTGPTHYTTYGSMAPQRASTPLLGGSPPPLCATQSVTACW